MEITADTASGTITVRVDATLSAREAQQLIAQLCNARAQIAQDPPEPKGQPISLFELPAWYTELRQPGNGPNSVLLMRMPGFGWIGITLNPHDRTLLASALARQQADAMRLAADATAPISAHQASGGTLH